MCERRCTLLKLTLILMEGWGVTLCIPWTTFYKGCVITQTRAVQLRKLCNRCVIHCLRSDMTKCLCVCMFFRSMFSRSLLPWWIHPLPALSTGILPARGRPHFLLPVWREPGDQAQCCCNLPGVWNQRWAGWVQFIQGKCMFLVPLNIKTSRISAFC